MTLSDLISSCCPGVSLDQVWCYVRRGLLRPPARKGLGRARGRTSSDWTESHARSLAVMQGAQRPSKRFNYSHAEWALIADGAWVRGDVLRRHVAAGLRAINNDSLEVGGHSRGVVRAFGECERLLRPLIRSALAGLDAVSDYALESRYAAACTSPLVMDISAFTLWMAGAAVERPLNGIDSFIDSLRPVSACSARPGRPPDKTKLMAVLQYRARLIVLVLTLLNTRDGRAPLRDCMWGIGLYVDRATKDVLNRRGAGRVDRVLNEALDTHMPGVW